MAKCLVRMEANCHRMGTLSGLFVCEEDDLPKITGGKVIYFGEVLGKHSEVELELSIGRLDNGHDLEIISRDQDVIHHLISRSGSGKTICGHNPFDHLD